MKVDKKKKKKILHSLVCKEGDTGVTDDLSSLWKQNITKAKSKNKIHTIKSNNSCRNRNIKQTHMNYDDANCSNMCKHKICMCIYVFLTNTQKYPNKVQKADTSTLLPLLSKMCTPNYTLFMPINHEQILEKKISCKQEHLWRSILIFGNHAKIQNPRLNKY